MPVESHLRNVVRFDIFTNYDFQHLVAHYWLSATVYLGFVQVVAIAAIQVAERPGRLEHYVECHRACEPDGISESDGVLNALSHFAFFLPFTRLFRNSIFKIKKKTLFAGETDTYKMGIWKLERR